MQLDLSLHHRQGLAFNSRATEILYGGAAGGGKSHLMRVTAIHSSAMVPGLQTYMFRRKYPELMANHMEGPTSFEALLAPWIDAKLCKINYSPPPEIEFWNGSKIFLRHCQHEKSVLDYQGTDIHQLLIDEITHWTASMFRYLRGRCRIAGLNLTPSQKGLYPRILMSGNPGGIGHNWVKSGFVDHANPMGIRKMPAVEGGMLRQYIPAKLADNPTLTESDPDYADRLLSLGDEALVRAMLEGDWDIIAGGMFDDVWRRDIHVVAPFDIPPGWRIDRSFDWGSSKPYSVGYWAEADGSQAPGFERYVPKGTLFRIAEIYGAKGENEGVRHTNAEIAKRIKAFEAEHGLKPRTGPADSAIFDDSTGTSIAKDMQAEGIRWEPSQKGPGSRVQGWQQIRKRLKAGHAVPMEEPGLFVFDNCHDFIRTVPVLPRDQRKPEDVDTDAEDHIGDETRYRLTAVRRTLSTGKMAGT